MESKLSKVKITGTIEVVTGLHIGGGGETGMIGAVDAPVIKDRRTALPIIPGSTLKGKLRTLLASKLQSVPLEHNQDPDEVCRLFGASGEEIIQARLQISDAFYHEETKKLHDDLEIDHTEIKFENTIDRQTAVAMPRQIERVIKGSKFNFQMIYNVLDQDEVEEDFENISDAFTLLEYDYLGGGGTRGNGRVKFEDIDIKTVIGSFDSTNLKEKFK